MSRAAVKIGLVLAAYLALAALPLALGLAQSLPRRPWRDELSSGLAMVAFAMLLLEFLLSGRNRAISRSIGMDVTMRAHQLIALAIVAFLLVHPFLYSLPYAGPRPGDPQRLMTVTLTPLATITGALAWALIPVLVGTAFLRAHLRYESWRLAHGLLAAAIVVLGTHHAIDTGRYAQDAALRVAWLTAGGLALAALAHVYLVKPLLRSRRPYRVAGVAREAERIWRIVLEPVSGRPFAFAAGQFVWVRFFRSLGRITEHPFSIASAPADLPRLEFLVKEAGDFTGSIGALPARTAAFLDGPYGNFTIAGREGDGAMLIAGGVGIAPVISIARDLAARRPGWPVRVLYADRTVAQLAARRELEALARSGAATVQHVIAEPPAGWTGLRGVAGIDNLRACLPPQRAQRWVYFVCGPPAMIDAVELDLARLGVPLAQIVSERFRYEGGVLTPRERLTRAVLGGAAILLVAAALAFSLR